MNVDKIRFQIKYWAGTEQIETHIGEYRNLMHLIKHKLYEENFGECGGLGRCATCVILTDNAEILSASPERNEANTLSKNGFDIKKYRLACQIDISKRLEGVTFEILDID